LHWIVPLLLTCLLCASICLLDLLPHMRKHVTFVFLNLTYFI
jgi:hypothetical protein